MPLFVRGVKIDHLGVRMECGEHCLARYARREGRDGCEYGLFRHHMMQDVIFCSYAIVVDSRGFQSIEKGCC